MPLILAYHAVSDRWPADLAISPADLERHVRVMKRRGYRFVTFHDAVTGTGGRVVAFTFDDAYRSVLRLAFPLLQSAGIVATVFAPTAFIGTDEPMTWPEVERWSTTEHRDEMLAMSFDDLGSLAEAGWEIGSHTRSHPHLPLLHDDELDAELSGSREDLERVLGRPCRSLAYPFGDHDQRVVEATRRAGYTAAAGTRPLRRTTGPLDVSRQVINRIDDRRRFELKTSGPTQLLRSSGPGRRMIALRRALRDRRVRGMSDR